MLIYSSSSGSVRKGWLSGFRFTISTGQVVKPTPWMKHRMGELHYALKAAGFDSMNDEAMRGLFWEYFLDLAHSPANGLYHRVRAEEPVEEVVAMFANAVAPAAPSQAPAPPGDSFLNQDGSLNYSALLPEVERMERLEEAERQRLRQISKD